MTTSKRPTKADRMLVAKHLRQDADTMRKTAQRNRAVALSDARPGMPEYFGKLASQQETRAARFERVADWVVSDE